MSRCGPPRSETHRRHRAVADYGWLKAVGRRQCRRPDGQPAALSARSTWTSFPKPHAFLMPDADEVARWKNAVRQDERHRHLLAQRQDRAAIAPCNMRRWKPGRISCATCRGTLVCVQYDATPDEIAALEQMSGRKIIVPRRHRPEERTGPRLRHAVGAGCCGQRAHRRVLAGGGRRRADLSSSLRHELDGAGPGYEPFAPSCECVMPADARRLGRCLRKARAHSTRDLERRAARAAAAPAPDRRQCAPRPAHPSVVRPGCAHLAPRAPACSAAIARCARYRHPSCLVGHAQRNAHAGIGESAMPTRHGPRSGPDRCAGTPQAASS